MRATGVSESSAFKQTVPLNHPCADEAGHDNEKRSPISNTIFRSIRGFSAAFPVIISSIRMKRTGLGHGGFLKAGEAIQTPDIHVGNRLVSDQKRALRVSIVFILCVW